MLLREFKSHRLREIKSASSGALFHFAKGGVRKAELQR
jgi:hypothetical protein